MASDPAPFPASQSLLEPPERPLSALSQATTASSASGGNLRERREVTHLNVNVPTSAAPFLPSRLRVDSGVSSSSRASGSADGDNGRLRSDEGLRASSQRTSAGSSADWVHSVRPQPSAIGGLNGLGLALNVETTSDASTDDDDDESEDGDAVAQLEPEERAMLNRPTIHEGATRQWGDEDFDDQEDDRGEGTSRPSLSGMRRPSAATFRAVSSSRLNPPATAASTGEEWRAKILESVRKGEERVAEKRKASTASLHSFDAGKTPLAVPASLPAVPDEALSASTSGPPAASSTLPTSLAEGSDAIPSDEPPAFVSLSPPPEPGQPEVHLPPQASLDLPLPPSPTFSAPSPVPSFQSHRSNAALLPPPPPQDEYPRGSALPPSRSPSAEAGTFLSVADPSSLVMRGSAASPTPPAASPARRTPRNFLSNFFNRDRSNTTGSLGHARSSSMSSLAREAGYRSQPGSPATSFQARVQNADGGMTRSASEGTRLSGFLSASTSSTRPGLERDKDSQMTIRPSSHNDEKPPTLASLGLKLDSLTPTMAVSRYPQPLCGAILDQKYLLIGTVNGLDFLPLQQVVNGKSGGTKKVTRPLKPISLIKKTKVKDLAVLETRSNILLAIAGRNDHLRVYALDGIRAMIEKKMAEVVSKDDFVWIPKSFSGNDIKRSASVKGKARANEGTSDTAGSSSARPSQPGSAAQSSAPTGLPPPYASPEAHEAPLPRLSPRPTLPPLRRSSTVREAPVSPRVETLLSSSRRPSSAYIRPVSPSSPIDRSPAIRTEARSTPSDRSPELELGLSRERESDDSAPDGTPSATSSADMNRTDSQNSIQRRQSALGKRRTARDATTTSTSMTGLAQMLKDTEAFAPGATASVGSSPKAASSPRSRMSPRSPVTRSASDTESTDEDATSPATGRRRGLSLADMLAEGPPGPIPEPRTVRSPTTPSRARMEPRSPTVREDEDAQPSSVGQRRASLAEILNEGPPPGVNGSPALSAVSMGRDRSGHSLASTAADQSPNLSRSRKRWSMMDSVLRATTSVGSPESSNRRRVDSPALDRIESREETSSAGVALQSDARPRRNLDSASAIAANPSTESPPVPPRLRTRPSTQKFRPSDTALGPDERIAERLATNKEADDAYTAPHPATLGAPLEYVKLARTKGARLLRAVETKRRTYLAVLCGDSGERVELFTGSKNISLSLNRTFVLPETPRSIEFQMQGDDLVDIYLVYDESVFALEPATVRVREVGIGRNERRAARRERERVARDAASVSTQAPSASGLAPRPSPPVHTPTFGLGISDAQETVAPANTGAASTRLAPIPETNMLSRPLPDTPPVTTPTGGASPPNPDDGLTLAPPTPPAPNRRAAVNSAATSAPEASAEATPGNEATHTPWPYTTFQQLSFTPPLPASVLASTYIIPPSYETVVTASTQNTPAPLHRSTMGSLPVSPQHSPSVTVHLPHGGDGDGTESHFMSPDPSSVPLLSPVSLLAPSLHRQAGPPGLFWISRGRKISAIVDCDGRSVLKRPFLWQSPSSHPTDAEAGLRRLEVLVVEQKRPIVVGFHAAGVGAFEVGGKRAEADDHWSNSAPLQVSALTAKSGSVPLAREVTFLGFSRAQNQVVWAERVGGNLGVFCLSASALA